MFCGACGTENVAANRYCVSCGKEILLIERSAEHRDESAFAGSGDASPAQPDASTAITAGIGQESHSHEERKLVGVKGWLLLFALGTAIAGPLVLVNQAVESGFGSTEAVFASTVCLVLAGLSASAGFLLLLRHVSALLVLKFYFGALLAVAALIAVVTVIQAVDAPDHAVDSTSKGFGVAFRTVLGAVIWASYFKRSRRVRLTFGRNL